MTVENQAFEDVSRIEHNMLAFYYRLSFLGLFNDNTYLGTIRTI